MAPGSGRPRRPAPLPDRPGRTIPVPDCPGNEPPRLRPEAVNRRSAQGSALSGLRARPSRPSPAAPGVWPAPPGRPAEEARRELRQRTVKEPLAASRWPDATSHWTGKRTKERRIRHKAAPQIPKTSTGSGCPRRPRPAAPRRHPAHPPLIRPNPLPPRLPQNPPANGADSTRRSLPPFLRCLPGRSTSPARASCTAARRPR